MGLVILKDLSLGRDRDKGGTITDREDGKMYKSELWVEGGKLKVRRYLGPFYRRQTWLKGGLMLPTPSRARAVLRLVLCWLGIAPASNDRDWLPEVAVTLWANRDADMITIHGVRNVDYRTETDFTSRWEDRIYDLRALDPGNLIAVYWAGEAIAYIMVSFRFGSRDYLVVSIETRKARGQPIPRSQASSSNNPRLRRRRRT